MINATLEKAVIKDKELGLSDVAIGAKYKITYRQLERIILKTKGINISILPTKRIKALQPPKFELENTTIWSFKSRGSWATHSGEYS